MPAIDVLPQSSGGGAIEQRHAGASSGGGGPTPTNLISSGFNGLAWRAVPAAPKTADNTDMETRLAKLEALIPALATKEEVVKLRGETREGFADVRSDMHKNTSEIIKWMVVTAVGLGVAAITVGTFVLNNAIPKTASTTSQQPIIINVPQGYERGNGTPAPPAKP